VPAVADTRADRTALIIRDAAMASLVGRRRVRKLLAHDAPEELPGSVEAPAPAGCVAAGSG